MVDQVTTEGNNSLNHSQIANNGRFSNYSGKQQFE